MKKYSRHDQIIMATWAADCAERVLPLFEEARPEDDRPRRAIEVCRTWVRTGVFRMAEIRGASLGAHAAARDADGGSAAQFAARAAGQAVATAHVPQHAYGAAYYALKAVAAADPANAVAGVAAEREWQAARLPGGLREEIMERIVVLERGGGVLVKLRKGEGF
ncbi:putative immunity protein [Methanoculleus chikugoensis]